MRISGKRSRKQFKEWESYAKERGFITRLVPQIIWVKDNSKQQGSMYCIGMWKGDTVLIGSCICIQRVKYRNPKRAGGRYTVSFDLYIGTKILSFSSIEEALLYYEMVCE